MRPLAGPLLCAVLAIFAAGAGAAPASDWLQAGHDVQRTWANPGEVRLAPSNVAGLGLQWSAALGQFDLGAPSQRSGGMAVCSNLSGLSGLRAASGAPVWSRPGLPGGFCGTPAIVGRSVVVATSDYSVPGIVGHLTSVAGASGAVQWSVSPGDEGTLGFNDPALAGGRLFVSGGRHAVYAYDAASGAPLWRAPTSAYNNAAAAGGGKVLVTTWNSGAVNKTHAFDAATGTPSWTADGDTSAMFYPALILRDAAYVALTSGKVQSLGLDSGALRWTAVFDGYISAPLAAAGGAVFVSSNNVTLSAIDAASGKTVWSRSIAPLSVSSNLVLANGVLYLVALGSGQQQLLTLDAATGTTIAQPAPLEFPGSYTHLTVAQGRVNAASNGVMRVFGLAP